MPNWFGIPENELLRIRNRDKKCVYCQKNMIYPYNIKNHQDSATIEHLSPYPPFYWKDGMKIKNITICCGSCNSSRWTKNLKDRFKTDYCKKYNINKNTVAEPVKEYLKTT
jgi:hypothetical protein